MQEEGLPSLQGGAWRWERSRWKARPASLVFLVFLVAVEALLDFLTDKVLPTFGKLLQLAGGVLQFLAGTIQFGRLEEETEFEVFADDLVKIPFDIFPEPWGISKRLKAGGFDAAYLADHCRLEARQANVPMVVSRELRPFYEGVSPNLIKMGKRLEEILDI